MSQNNNNKRPTSGPVTERFTIIKSVRNTKIQYTSIDYQDKNIQVTSQLKAGKFKSHAAVKYHETKNEQRREMYAA